jgi:hypothetical protein
MAPPAPVTKACFPVRSKMPGIFILQLRLELEENLTME